MSSDDGKQSSLAPQVSVEFDGFWFLATLFFLFWLASGWYRVDCALGVKSACDLIAAEKDYATHRAKEKTQ